MPCHQRPTACRFTQRRGLVLDNRMFLSQYLSETCHLLSLQNLQELELEEERLGSRLVILLVGRNSQVRSSSSLHKDQ